MTTEETKPQEVGAQKVHLRVMAALPTAALAVDGRGRVTYWSTRLADLTGYSTQEMLGKRSWQGFFTTKKSTPIELALRSEEEERDPNFVITHRVSNESVQVRFTARPVLDDADEVVGAVASLDEATKNADADKAHQQLMNLPAPVMEIDKDFNVVFLNAAGSKLVGVTPQTAVGRKCYDLFKTTHCRTPECRCAQAMQFNEPRRGETVADPTKLNVPIQYHGAPVHDDVGNVIGALEYVMDITDTKRAMDDALERVQYLNSVPTPIMVIDRDFNVKYMNPSGAVVLGETPEGVRGRKCYDLFKTTHCRTPKCSCNQAMQSRSVITEETVVDPDGKNIPIEYTGTPLYDGQGQVIGALEYVLDISERKAVLNEISNFAGNLAQGNLSVQMAGSYKGDYAVIATHLNRAVAETNEVMADINRLAQEMAQGNLTVEIKRQYGGDFGTIADALQVSVKSMHDALAGVAQSVEQVSAATQEIASSSQSVAQGASEQASSLEETSSSLEEMASMTRQNADNTMAAKSISQTTKGAAEKGGMAMQRMTDAMGKIRAASEGTAQIIKDINEIAFQTNLLALNAAVEAARAGDAGRGFAVVAEEVRNLALRSKEAAQKTESLIKEAVAHSENGRVISDEVATNLGEIISSVGKVNDIVNEIAVASQEQTRGIEQINKAVAEMDKVVQASAANAEESSSAAEELASQAEEMASQVSRFQLRRAEGGNIAARHSRSTGNGSPANGKSSGGKTRNGKSNGNGIRMRPEDIIPLENDPDFADF